MGKFKDLEIPENESDNNSDNNLADQNLTLFPEEVIAPVAGFSRTPRYLADVKSMLELLEFKIKEQSKAQRSKAQHQAA